MSVFLGRSCTPPGGSRVGDLHFGQLTVLPSDSFCKQGVQNVCPHDNKRGCLFIRDSKQTEHTNSSKLYNSSSPAAPPVAMIGHYLDKLLSQNSSITLKYPFVIQILYSQSECSTYYWLCYYQYEAIL